MKQSKFISVFLLLSLFSHTVISSQEVIQVSYERIAQHRKNLGQKDTLHACARFGLAGVGLVAYFYGLSSRLALATGSVGCVPVGPIAPAVIAPAPDQTFIFSTLSTISNYASQAGNLAVQVLTMGVSGILLNKYIGFVITPPSFARSYSYDTELQEHLKRIDTMIVLCESDPADYVEFRKLIAQRMNESVLLIEKIIASVDIESLDEDEQDVLIAAEKLAVKTNTMSQKVAELIDNNNFKQLGQIFQSYTRELGHLLKLLRA